MIQHTKNERNRKWQCHVCCCVYVRLLFSEKYTFAIIQLTMQSQYFDDKSKYLENKSNLVSSCQILSPSSYQKKHH